MGSFPVRNSTEIWDAVTSTNSGTYVGKNRRRRWRRMFSWFSRLDGCKLKYSILNTTSLNDTQNHNSSNISTANDMFYGIAISFLKPCLSNFKVVCFIDKYHLFYIRIIKSTRISICLARWVFGFSKIFVNPANSGFHKYARISIWPKIKLLLLHPFNVLNSRHKIEAFWYFQAASADKVAGFIKISK